jgi:hypothetical protein
MRTNISDRDGLVAWAGLLLIPLLFVAGSGRAVPRRPGPQAAGGSAAAFPLQPGTYWIYEAVARWGPANSSSPQEKLFHWKMAVHQVIHRGDLLVAVVTGFPRDLDRSHGDARPARSLIIEAGGSKFYWIPPASFAETLARLKNPKDSLGGLTDADEIFLDLPLTDGKKFCGPTGMVRTDGFYCWVVGEPEVAQLGEAKGIPAGATTAYPVHFLTVDDSTSFDFVPGVGITRYSFQTHGTINDTELRLLEFHAGSR